MKTQRQIIFHEHYFLGFYAEKSEKVQEKIELALKIKDDYFNSKRGK